MSGSLRSHDEWLGRFGSNTHVHFIEQVEYKCSSHWTLMAPQGGWEVSLLCEGPGCFDKAQAGFGSLGQSQQDTSHAMSTTKG